MDSATPSANPKAELADKLKSANNILVTVSRNPSVDQLAACLGLTLLLNKLNKHAAAVFSGEVPSTMEFLQPEQTIEKTTDSLRDFIIALDKSKADKLRYKVEDQVVRIFITPYRTSITQDDLDFSQGDFNVDVVVGLGVQSQDDLDEAITSHGRILHDATVATINTTNEGGLGSINWHEPTASSLSELVTELAQMMGKDLLDQQISTALLTGIVAETARFSNEKTSSQTMSISAALMAAGANQQLVATKLEEPPAPPATQGDNNGSPSGDGGEPAGANDGALDIDHGSSNDMPMTELPPVPDEPAFDTDTDDLLVPDLPHIELKGKPLPGESHVSPGGSLITEPPTIGSTPAITDNLGIDPQPFNPMADPLSLPSLEENHLLDHQNEPADSAQPAAPPPPEPEPAVDVLNFEALDSEPVADMPVDETNEEPEPAPEVAAPEPTVVAPTADVSPPAAPEPAAPAPVTSTPMITGLTPPPPAWVPPSNDPFNLEGNSDKADAGQTLADIEASVHSTHLDTARDEVSKALNDGEPAAPEPIQALNAQPLSGQLHDDQPPAGISSAPAPTDYAFDPSKFDVLNDPEAPSPSPAPAADTLPSAPQVIDPTAPPPVPPPIPFQFGGPSGPPPAP